MSNKLSICNIIKNYVNNNLKESTTYIFFSNYSSIKKEINVNIIIKKININNSLLKKKYENSLSFNKQINYNLLNDKLLIKKIINNDNIYFVKENINLESSYGMKTKIKKNNTNFNDYSISLNKNNDKIIYFRISEILFNKILKKIYENIYENILDIPIKKITIKKNLDIPNIDNKYKNFIIYFKNNKNLNYIFNFYN